MPDLSAQELKTRIMTLEEVVTKKVLYRHVPKDTVRRWYGKENRSSPRSETSDLWLSSLPITWDQTCGPENDFSAAAAECAAKAREEVAAEKFTKDRVLEILAKKRQKVEQDQSRHGDSGIGALLNVTKGLNTLSSLKAVYPKLQGYYFGYVNWVKEFTNTESPEIKPYRFLIHIDGIDRKARVINAKLTSEWQIHKWRNNEVEDKWGYKGILVPTETKLFFIFASLADKECIFIITRLKNLAGVFSAELSDRTVAKKISKDTDHSLPASSRIILTKIENNKARKGEDALMEELRFCQLEDISGVDDEEKRKFCQGAEGGILC